jgi:hypothetical protein
MPQYPFIPEWTTVIEYPKSKRKVILNHKGEVISDSAKENRG